MSSTSICNTVISNIKSVWPDAECFAFPDDDRWVIELRSKDSELFYISIVGYWLYVNLPDVVFDAENLDTCAICQPFNEGLEAVLPLLGTEVPSFQDTEAAASFSFKVIKRIQELHQQSSSYILQSSPLKASIVLQGERVDKPEAFVQRMGPGMWKFGVRFSGGVRHIKSGDYIYTIQDDAKNTLPFDPRNPKTFIGKSSFCGDVNAMIRLLYDARVKFIQGDKAMMKNKALLETSRRLLGSLTSSSAAQQCVNRQPSLWRKEEEEGGWENATPKNKKARARQH